MHEVRQLPQKDPCGFLSAYCTRCNSICPGRSPNHKLSLDILQRKLLINTGKHKEVVVPPKKKNTYPIQVLQWGQWHLSDAAGWAKVGALLHKKREEIKLCLHRRRLCVPCCFINTFLLLFWGRTFIRICSTTFTTRLWGGDRRRQAQIWNRKNNVWQRERLIIVFLELTDTHLEAE